MWKATLIFDDGTIDEVGIFKTRQEALFNGEYAMGITVPYLIPEDKNSIEIKIAKKFNHDYSDMKPVEFKTIKLVLNESKEEFELLKEMKL